MTIQNRIVALSLIFLIFACSVPARAQIVAPAGRTLFNHGVMFRSFVRINYFDENAPGLQVRGIVNPYALIWGAYPNLSLSFVAPFVVLDLEDSSDPARDETRRGTGDLSVFARYDLILKNTKGGSTRLSPEFGVKFPTGGSFGTGSTDYIGTLVFSHVRNPHWLVTDFQFRYNTSGDNDLRFGNRWRFDVAYLFQRLSADPSGSPGLMLVLELNGESADAARVNGVDLSDTGGDIVFLSPGIEFFLSRRSILEFSLPVQIYEDLNGSQIEPTFSFIVGFRWLM